MLKEIEIRYLLLDLESATPKGNDTLTESEKALQMIAVDNVLMLVLEDTEHRRNQWRRFLGRES